MNQFEPTPLERCLCGCENLERVTVERAGRAPYLTDFVACTLCRVMYHSPPPRGTENSTAAIMEEVRRINAIPKPRKR